MKGLSPNASRFALLALFCGSAGIGFAPIFVRLSPVGPSATAFYRLLLALPILWLWMLCERRGTARSARPRSRADFGALALAGFLFAGDLAVWHWSLKLTSVANATLLANCAPVFVTIGAHFLFREKINSLFVSGMILAFAGASLVVGPSFGDGFKQLLGDGLGVVTALFYAAYMLSLKRLRSSFSTATIMAWSGLFSCAALLGVTLLSAESLHVGPLGGWGVLAGLAVISHAAAQSLIAFAFAHLSASFSSVGLLLQPVVAALLAWLILAEGLTMVQAIGGVVVLAGITLAKTQR